jgi:hypothetical protein
MGHDDTKQKGVSAANPCNQPDRLDLAQSKAWLVGDSKRALEITKYRLQWSLKEISSESSARKYELIGSCYVDGRIGGKEALL